MSDVELTDINPVPLTAVVTSTGSGYTVSVQYNVPPATAVSEFGDTFRVSPSTVTINVTSSTVPSGYHLEATGDGTWTTLSPSSISGAFTIGANGTGTFDFTIVVTNGAQILCSHDPRMVVKKLSSW